MSPVLTYSDTVLYNWCFKTNSELRDVVPELNSIRSRTGLVHEEEFYLYSARIELRGGEILEMMRMTMDETFYTKRHCSSTRHRTSENYLRCHW